MRTAILAHKPRLCYRYVRYPLAFLDTFLYVAHNYFNIVYAVMYFRISQRRFGVSYLLVVQIADGFCTLVFHKLLAQLCKRITRKQVTASKLNVARCYRINRFAQINTENPLPLKPLAQKLKFV